jgi:hypothetical protein
MEPTAAASHRPLIGLGANPLGAREPATAFATVVVDDFALSGVDGIQWLADRCGELVARKVANLAAKTKDGTISPAEAFTQQLLAIRPRRADVDALARAYIDAMTPRCSDAIARFRRAGVRVVFISGGIRNALYGLAYRLGIDAHDVHAVGVRFDALGAYLGFDRGSPLLGSAGTRAVLAALATEGPVLVVGSQLAGGGVGDVLDSFVTYTGLAKSIQRDGAALLEEALSRSALS